jgi:hypothetical protein
MIAYSAVRLRVAGLMYHVQERQLKTSAAFHFYHLPPLNDLFAAMPLLWLGLRVCWRPHEWILHRPTVAAAENRALSVYGFLQRDLVGARWVIAPKRVACSVCSLSRCGVGIVGNHLRSLGDRRCNEPFCVGISYRTANVATRGTLRLRTRERCVQTTTGCEGCCCLIMQPGGEFMPLPPVRFRRPLPEGLLRKVADCDIADTSAFIDTRRKSA